MNTRSLSAALPWHSRLVDHNAAEYLNSHSNSHTITYVYAHDTYESHVKIYFQFL